MICCWTARPLANGGTAVNAHQMSCLEWHKVSIKAALCEGQRLGQRGTSDHFCGTWHERSLLWYIMHIMQLGRAAQIPTCPTCSSFEVPICITPCRQRLGADACGGLDYACCDYVWHSLQPRAASQGLDMNCFGLWHAYGVSEGTHVTATIPLSPPPGWASGPAAAPPAQGWRCLGWRPQLSM